MIATILSIAPDAFDCTPFLARYIERAGTGTLDMIALCKEAGLLQPQFRQDGGQFVQTLWRPAPQATPQDKTLSSNVLQQLAEVLGMSTPQAAAQVATQVTKALEEATEAVTRETLQEAMAMKDREHFRQAYLEPLVAAAWLERTIPDKPTSPNQKYRLTEKGRAWLAARSKKGEK